MPDGAYERLHGWNFEIWLDHHVDCKAAYGGPCTCARLHRRESVRYFIAGWLNRLPWSCWANLVMWAQGYRRWPSDAFARSVCKRDCAANGQCWCGKIGRKDAHLG